MKAKKYRLSDAVSEAVKSLDRGQLAKFRRNLERELPAVIEKCAKDAREEADQGEKADGS